MFQFFPTSDACTLKFFDVTENENIHRLSWNDFIIEQDVIFFRKNKEKSFSSEFNMCIILKCICSCSNRE